MKILITGALGFVGSYVQRHLEKTGYDVIAFSNLSHPSNINNLIRYEYGDVRYLYDLDRLGKVDVCIHLAAKINVDRSRENAEGYVDTNIKGTYNVLEYCRKYNIKLIYAATSEALGSMLPEYNDFGMDESHPFYPDNPYGATKAAAEMLILGWVKQYGMNCTILRSFNVCGVGQSYDKEGAFIPKTVKRVLDNQNPIIFGNGEQTRDYLWVGDLARAYGILVENQFIPGDTFHVGTGIEHSINYIANKIIELSKRDLHIEYIDPRPGEVKRLKCNPTKFMNLTDWKPTKTIDEVLSEYF